MFSWFSTKNAERFGNELATFILRELGGAAGKADAKFTGKAEKVLARAGEQVRQFKAGERLNFYKKAKLANAFLWTLKDKGCSPEYANRLTDWLSVRL